jgi:hypothetical protein
MFQQEVPARGGPVEAVEITTDFEFGEEHV